MVKRKTNDEFIIAAKKYMVINMIIQKHNT